MTIKILHKKHKAISADIAATKRTKVQAPHEDLPKELHGLSEIAAAALLKEHGPNELITKVKKHIILVFLSYFKNPLILILTGAAIVSGILGEIRSAVVILIIVISSVILNFVQEQKSSREVEHLQEKLSLTSTVIRNGKKEEINIRQIVPGDIVFLSAGDILPADGQILKADDFFVNESVLTGESFPMEKQDYPIAGQPTINLAFAGTTVISGYAYVKIEVTGAKTRIGQIAETLEVTQPPSSFENGINSFGYMIIKLTFFIVVTIFIINTFKPLFLGQAITKESFIQSFLFAIAVAVGLTPELLPMIMSINMAKGSLKMAEKGVIVKRLNAIPDFGSIDTLCTDKTGTLTEGVVTLVKYLDVTGASSEEVLKIAYLNSYFQTGMKNPLDGAILNFKHLSVGDYQKIDEIPYDFDRKRLSMVVKNHRHSLMITKGQTEEILKICQNYQESGEVKKISAEFLASFKKITESLANQGFRTLAIATRQLEKLKENYEKVDEKEMTLIGLMCFFDPPKATAGKALENMEKYGIEIKIITGDNELVTKKICNDLHLAIKGIMTGNEVDKLNDEELSKKSQDITIFARFSPAQKSRVIKALRASGRVVGYMGDGINDAPSLKAADVGISVNNAVDVAKDSADIILLKKSLRQLTDGILEGRKTFGNTMKYLMMGLSSNFGNMFSLLFAVIYLPFLPMLSYQILLNNSLYDISQTTIPSDKVDEEYLQKPKRWNMSFMKKFMFTLGPISSIFDITTFIVMFHFLHLGEHALQTSWFIESLATQTLVVYIIRTRKLPFIQSSPSKYLFFSVLGVVLTGIIIPYTPLGSYFDFIPLSMRALATIGAIVAVYLVMVEFMKQWFYKKFNY